VWSGFSTRSNVNPACPLGRPGPRPDLARNDLGAGLASPSELGGSPEFLDDTANRASSSPIRVKASARAALNSAFSVTNCSYDGCDATPDPDTRRSKQIAPQNANQGRTHTRT
jgi:hypothetical protein